MDLFLVYWRLRCNSGGYCNRAALLLFKLVLDKLLRFTVFVIGPIFVCHLLNRNQSKEN